MVRLQLILGISLLAIRALGAWDCKTQEECDQRCRENQAGDACTRMLNGRCNGCCTGDGKQYHDPDTGTLTCCGDKGTEFMTDKKHPKKGDCCGSGDPKHAYFWDPKSETGSCCPANSTGFDGTHCTEGGDKPDPDPDPEKPKGCSKQVCPKGEHDLGFEYGKCYMFKNPEGETLAKNAKSSDYVWGGVNNGHWHFRVCKSTKDCSRHGPVGKNDEFVLNDVIGEWGISSKKPTWMCTSVHYKACPYDNLAKKLKAIGWCADDCGICLKGFDHGIGPVCPVPKGGGIGDNNNEKICTPLTVWEVPCMYPDEVSRENE